MPYVSLLVRDDELFLKQLYVAIQEKELIQLRREAKLKGGFYVEPEAKLLFIIRIRGLVIIVKILSVCSVYLGIYFFFFFFSINAMHPKTRSILQLLRLRQVRD